MSDLKQRDDAKIDPISVEGLRAWLMMQPANRRYEWPACGECLVGTYLREVCYSHLSEKEWRFNAALIYEEAVYRMTLKCPQLCIFFVGAGASGYSQRLFNRDADYQAKMRSKWTCGDALKRLNALVR